MDFHVLKLIILLYQRTQCFDKQLIENVSLLFGNSKINFEWLMKNTRNKFNIHHFKWLWRAFMMAKDVCRVEDTVTKFDVFSLSSSFLRYTHKLCILLCLVAYSCNDWTDTSIFCCRCCWLTSDKTKSEREFFLSFYCLLDVILIKFCLLFSLLHLFN